MNKEIITINGSTLVEDENGNKTKREYSDNLNYILITENIIEELEEQKSCAEENIAFKKKNIEKSKSYLKLSKKMCLGSTIIMPVIIYALCYYTGSVEMLLPNLGNVSLLIYMETIFTPLTFALSYSILVMDSKRILKENINTLNGYESELNFINNEIENRKNTLVELKKAKKDTRENINSDLKVEKIDYKEKLETVREHLKLYYRCGYYYDKLLKLYDKGKLREKVSNYYNTRGVDLVEEYVENHIEEYSDKKLELKSTNS